MLRSSGIGRKMAIKEGTHAFVVLGHDEIDGKPFFRRTLMAFAFGMACDHPKLANDQDVIFAGEIEFDGEERIVRWNNLSGTYQAPDDLASQAGLPMDRFWAFRKTPKATRLPTKDVEGTNYAGEEVRVEAGEEKENMVKVMQGEKTIWLVRQRSAVEVLESLTERESAALLAAMQRVAGEHTR